MKRISFAALFLPLLLLGATPSSGAGTCYICGEYYCSEPTMPGHLILGSGGNLSGPAHWYCSYGQCTTEHWACSGFSQNEMDQITNIMNGDLANLSRVLATNDRATYNAERQALQIKSPCDKGAVTTHIPLSPQQIAMVDRLSLKVQNTEE